ncbi:hypothetical protein MDA_GLEAN10011077 [Myotis davidii]|uniref:Uncharacterized protein n=1 Tax=Myotis davidii TaxID=225400 RepID=L5M7F9_MYODS|nr:hypothetical protein MDA_GLEAN10011077 [Myotis davidii]
MTCADHQGVVWDMAGVGDAARAVGSSGGAAGPDEPQREWDRSRMVEQFSRCFVVTVPIPEQNMKHQLIILITYYTSTRGPVGSLGLACEDWAEMALRHPLRGPGLREGGSWVTQPGTGIPPLWFQGKTEQLLPRHSHIFQRNGIGVNLVFMFDVGNDGYDWNWRQTDKLTIPPQGPKPIRRGYVNSCDKDGGSHGANWSGREAWVALVSEEAKLLTCLGQPPKEGPVGSSHGTGQSTRELGSPLATEEAWLLPSPGVTQASCLPWRLLKERSVGGGHGALSVQEAWVAQAGRRARGLQMALSPSPRLATAPMGFPTPVELKGLQPCVAALHKRKMNAAARMNGLKKIKLHVLVFGI